MFDLSETSPASIRLEQPGYLHTAAVGDRRHARQAGHPMLGVPLQSAVGDPTPTVKPGGSASAATSSKALQTIPLSPGRWTLVVPRLGRCSRTRRATARSRSYMMPSLGGSTTLRSFSDYRFHDRHCCSLSAESRWALFEHIDAAVFVGCRRGRAAGSRFRIEGNIRRRRCALSHPVERPSPASMWRTGAKGGEC